MILKNIHNAFIISSFIFLSGCGILEPKFKVGDIVFTKLDNQRGQITYENCSGIYFTDEEQTTICRYTVMFIKNDGGYTKIKLNGSQIQKEATNG